MPVYTCLWPPFVGIVAKVAERHKAASPSHVTKWAQISYAVRAGLPFKPNISMMCALRMSEQCGTDIFIGIVYIMSFQTCGCQTHLSLAEISELRSKSDLRGHITHWRGLKIDMRSSNIKNAARILSLRFFKM